MRKLLFLAIVVLALGSAGAGAWYIASPWTALNGLRQAAVEMDRAELEERIDFASVRESLRPQLRGYIQREIDRQSDPGPLERLAGALALGASDRLLDEAMTPEGLAAIASGSAAATPLLPESLTGQEIDWSVERDGVDRFRALGTVQDGNEALTLVFDRNGLGWDLTGIELPSGES